MSGSFQPFSFKKIRSDDLVRDSAGHLKIATTEQRKRRQEGAIHDLNGILGPTLKKSNHRPSTKLQQAREIQEMAQFQGEERLNDDQKEQVLQFVFGRQQPDYPICFISGKQIIQQPIYFYYNGLIAIDPISIKYTQPCKNCGFPVKISANGKAPMFCHFCKKYNRCGSTQESINPETGTHIPNVRGFYSRTAVEDLPSCDACGRPVNHKGTHLDEGRSLCVDCSEKQVLIPEQVNDMQIFLPRLLEKQFPKVDLSDIREKIQLHWVQPTLKNLGEIQGKHCIPKQLNGKVLYLIPGHSQIDKVYSELFWDLSPYLISRFQLEPLEAEQRLALQHLMKAVFPKLMGFSDYYESYPYLSGIKNESFFENFQRLMQSERRIGFQKLIHRLHKREYNWNQSIRSN